MLKMAAITIALLGERTRVPMTVAMALAASLKPLTTPKPRARMIIRTSNREGSGMLEGYPLKDISHILTPVSGALHMLINLSPLDNIGRIFGLIK